MEKLVRDMGLGLLTSFLATFGGCLAGGCDTTHTNKHGIGFEQTTQWGFYNEAQDTGATATSKIEAPALVELILGPPKPESTDGDTP